MATHLPRYSPEEHARLGAELYERQVRPQVEDHRGEIVAIDVDTGSFEIARDGISAAKRLLARLPTAQIWCVRVGFPAVHRFGLRGREAPS